MQNPSQIWPKINEKRVGKHPEAAKSTDAVTEPNFFQSFCFPRPYKHYDFDNSRLKKTLKMGSKN